MSVTQQRAQQAVNRAQRRALRQQSYHAINRLFHVNSGDFVAFLKTAAKWTALGGAVGSLAGTASAIFLISLAWATQFRLDHSWLLFLLPLAGLGVGWIYARFGGAAALGNNLVIEEVNLNQAQIPLRMAPLVLIGTLVTHLFGGSAGREGTAIQMGASLADSLRRLLHLNLADRRLLIMAGISGGFGSVFGVPSAGFVFGMEVQSVGRIRYEGIIPCLVAAYVGDMLTRAWGAPHSHYPHLVNLAIDPLLLLKVALAGVLFGLTSVVFVELTHGIKQIMRRISGWSPLHPVLGGAILIGLTWLLGTTDYLGLSLPLIQNSVDGSGVAPYAFLWKLLFTAITLGTGYLGGEVTPLFVVGSTLGHTLGGILGVDPTFLASIGLVAVFAGASNTPLACAIMGIELFGGGSTLYLFLGCVVAYLASGHRGIYVTQAIGSPKAPGVDVLADESLKALAARRGGGWLPRIPSLIATLGQTKVQHIMTQPAVAVPATLSLDQAVTIALDNGVRALPIVDAQHQPVGMLTDNDLQRRGLNTSLSLLQRMKRAEQEAVLATLGAIEIQEVMTHPAVTIDQAATLATATQLFSRQGLKRLPVVDQRGQLVGVVTRSDILRAIAFADLARLLEQDDIFAWETRVSAVELETAITVPPTTLLPTLLAQLRAQNQKRALITDATGQIIGIISESDLVDQRGQNQPQPHSDAASTTVADIMTTPVITLAPDSRVADAIRLLITHQIKRLPVVDQEGHVLGLVGRAGLLRALLA